MTLASRSKEYTRKINGTEFELLLDVKMILDYEHSIRERIARAVCHYAGANNKYM